MRALSSSSQLLLAKPYRVSPRACAAHPSSKDPGEHRCRVLGAPFCPAPPSVKAFPANHSFLSSLPCCPAQRDHHAPLRRHPLKLQSRKLPQAESWPDGGLTARISISSRTRILLCLWSMSKGVPQIFCLNSLFTVGEQVPPRSFCHSQKQKFCDY